MKKLTMLLSVSLLSLSLPACTSVMTAGVKKGDERNLARSINDVSAGRVIKARMLRQEGFELAGVDVEVAQGIVVLSGNVPRDVDRIEAERIAWSGPQILQVGNEVLISTKQGIINNTKDGILNKSVRARLIATKSVKARNYDIEVNNGVVYLLGVARTPTELSQAAYIASTTKGTAEVISYVRLANDQSLMTAQGPGFNGEPSASQMAMAPSYGEPYTPLSQAPGPDTISEPLQNYGNSAPSTGLDNDAIESGEPYYRDPVTGERVIIPEGVTPIPYVPGVSPAPISDGTQAPYNIDPATGNMVPVSYTGN